MRPWQTLSLAAAGMIFCTSSVEAQTTLRFKFKEGDQFGYVLEQKMKMTTGVMGKNIEMNMDQTMEMSWHILKVEKDGSAAVKIQFTGAKMTMGGPMGKVEVDSKNPQELNDPVGKTLGPVVKVLGEMEMTLAMDPTGEIKDIKIPEKVKDSLKNLPGAQAMGDLFSDESLKKMAHGGIVLPREAVSTGKNWNQKMDMKMPGGRLKVDMLYTYEGPAEKDGKKLEKIAVKPSLTVEADPNAPVQMKMKNQSGKGYLYFDNEAGKLAAVDMTQNMEMTLDVNNMMILQKVEQHTIMKLAK